MMERCGPDLGQDRLHQEQAIYAEPSEHSLTSSQLRMTGGTTRSQQSWQGGGFADRPWVTRVLSP